MKRLFFILGVCIVSQIAVAQCKPTITLSISGCSGSFDGRLAERTAEALFNHYMEQAGIGFRSKQECDAFVGMVKSELDNLGTGNCRIHVNVSPCTGCLGSLSNEANIIAIGQGSSFYSTNPVNEINDWSKDYMDRMLALNPKHNNNSPNTMEPGDINYDRARLNERNNFGTPSYSGNNYTGDRYNSNRKSPINFSERNKLEEKFIVQETNDFIRTTKYQELPSMSTESFIEYCSQITKDAEHIRDIAPEVNYQLYCSETTENGQKVQNVFVEYIMPKNAEVSIMEDPFVEHNNKLRDIGDSPISTEDIKKYKELSEKSVLEEQMKKLEEEIEEIERAKRKEEYEASFAKRMIDELEKNQIEESFYIARNLSDLGLNQIPFDDAGKAGKVFGESLGIIIEKQFEKVREEAGIPEEPENIVADCISEIRELPGLGDLAKNYLGKTVGWFIVNAPEVGKTFGHGLAKINIFSQQREWKNKAELHTEEAQILNREGEIKKKELQELQEKIKQYGE